MIDTNTWTKFKVSDIFVTEKHGSGLQVPTGAMMSKKDLLDGDIPRVTVSNFNNGITGYYADSNDKNYRTYQNFISVSFLGTVFYQPDKVSLDMKVHCLKPIDYELNVYSAGYIVSIIRKAISNFAYSDQLSSTVLAELEFALPTTSDGQPDWDYMESYMKTVMEESEEYIRIVGGSSSNSKYIDVSEWGEFKLSDLFTKKTMKGYPKKAESYEEVENGYHIYGQNIGWQYPYKVLMDEQYLHKIEPNKPILAYASSVGEIGLINESFYRSGDNGAFQGLFPIGYHPNLLQMQFVLSILKKEFEAFRYDTSMQNTMDITFKLPITSDGEPDWQYMENYMKNIMDKSERIIEETRKVMKSEKL